MKAPPVKNHWIEQAVAIHNFYIERLKEDSSWTLQDTATMLNRSIGSISQAILISTWLKTHEKQLRKFSCMRDALAFVRSRQRELRLGGG